MASSMTELETEKAHYNDWPNTQGFNVTYEERTPVELEVEGSVPTYATGTLFRTGLGVRDIKADDGKSFRVQHWFDSLSQVHRFQIHTPTEPGGEVRVTYNSRSTCDGLIAKIKRKGTREGVTFGAKYDPCMSFFQKASSKFMRPSGPPPMPLNQAPPENSRLRPTEADEMNIAVTVNPNYPGLSRTGKKVGDAFEKAKVESLCNRTDTDAVQFLDPETLEPIGIASQAILHPLLKGPSSAAHSSLDVNGDVYNYNLEFCKGRGIYRVFSVSASSGETSVLATITDDPSYIHSILLTENYAILCVWNALYAYGGASILWTKNIVDSLAAYNPDRPSKWYVVDKIPPERGGRGLVATYESDPFFCFHTINAYEEVDEQGKVNVIADLVAYEDLDILKRLYIDNLLSDSPTAPIFLSLRNCLPQICRFTLQDVEPRTRDLHLSRADDEPEVREATSVFIASKDLTPELPTINPRMSLKQHRFVYGVLHSGKSSLFDSIVKYDVSAQTAAIWSKHGHTPGEPIFVADPLAEFADEDAGVLLSVILDGIVGKSYLLVLDAKTMQEVGKAHVDGVIGFGFHGTHTVGGS